MTSFQYIRDKKGRKKGVVFSIEEWERLTKTTSFNEQEFTEIDEDSWAKKLKEKGWTLQDVKV